MTKDTIHNLLRQILYHLRENMDLYVSYLFMKKNPLAVDEGNILN